LESKGGKRLAGMHRIGGLACRTGGAVAGKVYPGRQKDDGRREMYMF